MPEYKAFVCSTFVDLEEHRAYVIEALRDAGFSVDPMENWTADKNEPKVFSQERVEGCDLCILLVAFRRGHVPDGETDSITQMEYRYAKEHGVDVLPFLLDEKAAWPRDFDEMVADPDKKRRADRKVRPWRKEIAEHQGVGFFDTDPQTIEIAPALTRWLKERKEAEDAAGSRSSTKQTTPAGPRTTYWLRRPASLDDGFVGRDDDMTKVKDALN